MEFEIHPSTARASKRHGIYRFTEMTDWHMGLIAAAGLVANLFAAMIGYIIGAPEFTKLSIYYACFCLIPFGNLDGTKIFFGSIIIWFTLLIICAVFLSYAFWIF